MPAPYLDSFAARMPDGRFLVLPLREAGASATAELACDQASFLVLDTLAEWVVRAVRPLRPEVVAGLSGRAGALAIEVARRLMHTHWVPIAEREQPWFSDALSEAVPEGGAGTRWWLDPGLVGRIRGRRAILVHDVFGPGDRADIAARLLVAAGAAATSVVVAMTQGDAWYAGRVRGIGLAAVFATPSFDLAPGGWVAREGSAAWSLCPLFRQGVAAPQPIPRFGLPPTGPDERLP